MAGKSTIFVICICLVSIKHNACTSLVHREGNQASLSFHFLKPNISVALHKEHNLPFYINHHLITERLNPSEQIRFGVEEIHRNGTMEVQFTIKNTSRKDTGVYSCSMGSDSNMKSDSQSLTLNVKFPPGGVSCSVATSPFEFISHSWEVIECQAEAGSEPSDIVCFQNEEMALPISQTKTDHAILSRLVWKKKSSKISCCTSNKFQSNQSNELLCDDFTLLPTESGISSENKMTLKEKRSKFTANIKHDRFLSAEQECSIKSDVIWKHIFILLTTTVLVLTILNLLITSNVYHNQDNSLRMISEILNRSNKK